MNIKEEISGVKGMEKHYDREKPEYTFYEVTIDNGKMSQDLVVNESKHEWPKKPEVGDKLTIKVEFEDAEE